MKRATKISEAISCRVVPGKLLSREACRLLTMPFMLKNVKYNRHLRPVFLYQRIRHAAIADPFVNTA